MEGIGVVAAVALLSMVVLTFAPVSVDADEITTNEYISDRTFVAGSHVIVGFIYSSDWGSNTGPLKAVWVLKDSNGDTVFEWSHTPDEWKITAGSWYAKDTFDIQIPVMWGKEDGIWKIEGYVENGLGGKTEPVEYTFTVKTGGFFDNMNAPIYIYATQKWWIFTVGEVRWELPSPALITSPAWLLLLAFGLVVLFKKMAKSGWEQIEASKAYLKRQEVIK